MVVMERKSTSENEQDENRENCDLVFGIFYRKGAILIINVIVIVSKF